MKKTLGLRAAVVYTNLWEICLWELAGIDHVN